MKKIIFFLVGFLLISNLNAQDAGDIDPTFSTVGSFAVSGTVKAVAVQTDGKIIAVGTFSSYDGTIRNNIVRLAENGTVDASFNVGLGIGSGAECIALQSDGKVIIAGSFLTYNGTDVKKIVRLNTDGTNDNTFFNTGFGSGFIFALKVQPDGKIIAGGSFTSFNGTPVNKAIRLNTDGTRDESFATDDLLSTIRAVDIQADGKILLGGDAHSGANTRALKRVNANGTTDASFVININTLIFIRTIAIQTDGAIVTGDLFGSLMRFDSNGSEDTFFNSVNHNGTISGLTIQPDGKIIAVGRFSFFNGINETNNIRRVNIDGSTDTSFNPGNGFNHSVYAVALQSNGKILVGGDFSHFNQDSADSMVRINANGTVDNSYHTAIVLDTNTPLNSVVTQPDGKIVVGGIFNYYNSVPTNRIMRFNNDGSVDTGFNTGTGFTFGTSAETGVQNLAIQPDGKILAVGQFSEYNGTPIKAIARLNPDGTLDNSFTSPIFSLRHLHDVVLYPDGKMLIGGGYPFTPDLYTLNRLNPNGTFDNTFTSLEFDDEVISIAIQPDGKIVAGGFFHSYDGNPAQGVVRLNPNGTQDTTFDSGLNDNTYVVYIIALKPDGKIVLGGVLASSENFDSVACLMPNGTLDPNFGNGEMLDGFIVAILLQEDGKMIFGGNFTSYAGAPVNRIVRLDNLGNVDSSFESGAGFNGPVYDFSKQSDGTLIAVGDFQTYDNQIARQIVRLKNDDFLGNKTFAEKSTIVSPNPVKDRLTLSSPNDPVTSYEIFDLGGKIIISQTGRTNYADVSALQNGLYLIKIHTANSSSTQKFIKE